MFREHWRSSQEWKAEGLPLNTPSNEACKLFDAGLTQYTGWYDDNNIGGMEKTLTSMINADPNFVLGKAFAIGLELIGTGKTIRLDEELKSDLDELVRMKNGDDREKQYVEAIKAWANADLIKAANIFENILIEHPTDMLAIKFVHDTYFYLGKQHQMRDSVARVMPAWENKSLPLSSYLHGMYAFGLEETNFYEKGEKEAKKGLSLNQYDAWSTHALAHVYEMQGKTQEGIEEMSKTMINWERCNYLACHNFWHWALYHVEQQEYDAAMELFETQIGKRAFQSKTMLDIVDASSLLYRLDLLQPDKLVKLSDWDQVYSMVKPHLKDHILGFNDAHFMMACLGSKNKEDALEFFKSLSSEENGYAWDEVSHKVMDAMIAYDDENYVKTVDYLNDVRYEIVNMGGSNAQRDVFNQLLIVASLKSPLQCHKKLCQTLIHERESFKNSPLISKLMSQSVM